MDIFYPFQLFSDWVVYDLFHLSKTTVLGEAINFFVYDSIKIFFLLLTIIFVVSFIRSYFPPEKTKKLLSSRFEIVGNFLASLVGIVTPFCSCSAVPLFIGLVESGVPLGVTFSYLIAAPMVNEVAAILLFGLFGPWITLIYILSGVSIAIVVGYILGKMKLEPLVQDYVWEIKIAVNENTVLEKSVKDRINESWLYTIDLIKKVLPYVFIGIAIGAFVHGYVPENFLAKTIGENNIFAVPLAILVGVPLYSNAAGTIPIVVSLIEKGLPVGTALAFMISVTAISLPEMIILRKVLKFKLLVIYTIVLTVGIMFTGYLFNYFM